MKNIKKFEEHKVVKSSDLITSGTFSPEYHIKKDKKEAPHIKKEGEFVKVDIKKSIPKNAIYLTDKQVEEYNEIAKEIKKLQKEQEKIIK